MANFNNHHHHHLLFSSLISDIKDYTGKDPLLPWLRGIRQMKDSLPPHLLKEKLPRFLQKCAQTFQTDRRYKNDLRYLRVWLHLMDFVDDPGAVLRTMEVNHIGRKRSLFYQAYALYYEKIKKFEEAEKMYHLGVNNLSEPIGELQTSFEQFLQRMERHKNKRIQRQGGRSANRPQCVESTFVNCNEDKENNENIGRTKHRPTESCLKRSLHQTQPKMPMKESKTKELDETRNICGDDTVVVKFVDTAIVGRSVAEDACHHGLVEPTINTKEAMNAINSMFCEPLETSLVGRRKSHRTEPRADNTLKNGFEVFVDENLDNGIGPSNQNMKQGKKGPETHQPVQESFQIFIDDEENNDIKDTSHRKDNFDHSKVEKLTEENMNAFVFPNPKDLPSQCSEVIDGERPRGVRPREDTVVFRFVGSTISDEPVVENVCHHGLVEPTVNLKEAMDDINSMFGKPIEFTRKNRPKKQERAPDGKRARSGFLILPDDELHHQQRKLQPSSSSRKESDLFEPTVCTKEAMNEINKMFGMPLDF